MNSYPEKIARILRIDGRVIKTLERDLEKATGKFGVLKNIVENNERLVSEKMEFLGVPRRAAAHEIFDALISKVESDDLAFLKYLNIASLRGAEASQVVVDFIKKIHPPQTGFFLKKEKARQLLMNEPPKKVLAAMNCKYTEELLQKQNLLEVYSALRFLEEPDWLNNVFFKQYEQLRPDDFEERPAELRALSVKWARAAEKFVAKKYHNVSHLKELGVIFVIPVFLGISGETLRLVSLLKHYLYEIRYYSELFKELRFSPDDFARHFISLLRGDVIERRLPEPLPEARRPRFLVIQRYLAKDDENDWRLFEPHINPEALHWQRAEDEIVNFGKLLPEFRNGLDFWHNLGWVGDYFPTETGVEALVSFNLIDTVMALVKQRELVKYLYHHQESLWNKIFSEYFGLAKLEAYSKKYILQGWFQI
jgi:hypothetical protein